MHVLPESPRYLLRAGKESQARLVLQRIYPRASTEQIDLKISFISAVVNKTVLAEQAPPLQRLGRMFKVGKTRRALIIACGLQALQQLSGFNSLM